jgi:methionyl-tRNA formyltransferase
MRALVFGYHTMGCVGFDALLRHGFTIPAVYTHRDNPDEEIWWDSLADRASSHGIPVHHPTTLKDEAVQNEIISYAPDFIFSFYYRYMIPQVVLDAAPKGALNLHGSLLPSYRGRAPVNWVLVNGEAETGVSLHYMVSKPDAGNLVDQQRVPIDFEDTALTLYKKLESAAKTLLDKNLPLLREGKAPSRPLDLTAGSYFGRRRPEDGEIDWTWPAVRIYNLVRAVTHPYPGAFCRFRGRKFFIWWGKPLDGQGGDSAGTITEITDEAIVVEAGGSRFKVLRCQLEEGPECSGGEFAREHNLKPGFRLAGEGDHL